MQTLRVILGPRSDDIAIVHGDPARFAAFVRERLPDWTKALFVADANTRPHADALAKVLGNHPVAVVPAGEASKSLALAAELYGRLADMAADRKSPVVAVGGGVVGDLAGFVAATFNRGLPLVMVPTTLLAMVDSSVGGKVGVNLPQGKNLVGTFHQPAGVWIDTAVLDTLPDREFRSGLAEVVKYGVILDAGFFDWLESNAAFVLQRHFAGLIHLIARSCQLKALGVEQDEREELGLRAVLNYAHTFAHAFESVAGYGDWLHGEAVAAGMICASRLAERLGMISPDLTRRQKVLLESLDLPTSPLQAWPVDELIAVMRRDKKAAGGKLRFVLPTRIGEVRMTEDVPETLVREVLCRT